MRKIIILFLCVLVLSGLFSCDDTGAGAGVNTYTIKYIANGADSGTVPAEQVKTEGVDLTLSSNSGDLVKSGYNFGGWNTTAEGTGTNYAEGFLNNVDADLDLYAKWIEIVYKAPVPMDANLIVKSIDQENSRLSSKALGSGELLATPEVVTARGSDISFYTIGGVDFGVTETLNSKVRVPLGVDEDADGETDEIEEAFKWMPDSPTEISAPDPGAFKSTYYDMVVINIGQGIFKVTYDDGSGSDVYNRDSGYAEAAEMTPPYIYNQVSATLDPKTGFDEDGPRALGLTASNIILVDRQIINRIVYVPSTVYINVGLNSSTLNSEMAGATPGDVGVATLATSDYSYLKSNEIKFIESFFKEESAYDVFGFLLIPFDGIDLRVEEGESLPTDPEVEIILNWDITNCLELDPDDGNKPYFAKRSTAGGELPFDFSVAINVP